MSNVLSFPRAGGAKDEQIVLGLALMVSGIALPEQASALLGIPSETLLELLGDPQVQLVVDAEVLRLQHGGKLANLKAEKLANRMLDRLLATDDEAISVGMAAKLAELGLKFRSKETDPVIPRPNAQVIIRGPGDPEPDPCTKGEYQLVIDLSRVPPDMLGDRHD